MPAPSLEEVVTAVHGIVKGNEFFTIYSLPHTIHDFQRPEFTPHSLQCATHNRHLTSIYIDAIVECKDWLAADDRCSQLLKICNTHFTIKHTWFANYHQVDAIVEREELIAEDEWDKIARGFGLATAIVNADGDERPANAPPLTLDQVVFLYVYVCTYI